MDTCTFVVRSLAGQDKFEQAVPAYRIQNNTAQKQVARFPFELPLNLRGVAANNM
jgi:hypothetical protein